MCRRLSNTLFSAIDGACTLKSFIFPIVVFNMMPQSSGFSLEGAATAHSLGLKWVPECPIFLGTLKCNAYSCRNSLNTVKTLDNLFLFGPPTFRCRVHCHISVIFPSGIAVTNHCDAGRDRSLQFSRSALTATRQNSLPEILNVKRRDEKSDREGLLRSRPNLFSLQVLRIDSEPTPTPIAG